MTDLEIPFEADGKGHYRFFEILPGALSCALRANAVKPSQLLHAVIIATVNESREVLEPTIQAVIDADYDSKQMLLVLAYEGRSGPEAEARVHELLKLYGSHFQHAMAVRHP